ncbi:GWxTD domain-containing protein [Rubrivirga sp.]|uniref:GWxTD domain-containing protein n=1 Tax=Rubrivirga sp. TaxID=1885344 RepID=UPI003B517596
MPIVDLRGALVGRRAALVVVLLGACPPTNAQPAALDAVQADAFVRAVFGTRDVARYDPAADAYLGLLATIDSARTPEAEAVLRSALRQLAPVVPHAERTAWGLDADALPVGQGRAIVRWWREQDDLPATPANERLHEHLGRVAYALAAFSADDPRGYDDRGDVYVRLGPPADRVEVAVSPSVVAFDLDLNVPRSWTRVPANEVWTYPHVARGLHYVFVRPTARQTFRLATATDLVPPPLRNAGQGRGRLDALLVVMEEVYGQLALLDPAYGAVLDEVAGVIAGGSVADARSTLLAQSLLGHALDQDVAISGVRATLAPDATSATREGTDPLEAALRWARFRQPDGSTRLALQWGVPGAEVLRPSRRLMRDLRRGGVEVSDDSWVSLSLARLRADGAVGAVAHRHWHVDKPGRGPVTETVELVLDGPTPLAVQWQGRLNDPSGGTSRPGVRVKLGTQRLPELSPLPTSGLVLSDLQPLALDGRALRAHPFSALPASGLVLSFEVYGLARDADGRAQVRVEYRVAEAGGEATAWTSYEFGTDEAVAREQTEIDIAPWLGQAVDVTIRVTDVRAGESAERTVSFAVE